MDLKFKKIAWKLNQHFVTVMGVGSQMLELWGVLQTCACIYACAGKWLHTQNLAWLCGAEPSGFNEGSKTTGCL